MPPLLPAHLLATCKLRAAGCCLQSDPALPFNTLQARAWCLFDQWPGKQAGQQREPTLRSLPQLLWVLAGQQGEEAGQTQRWRQLARRQRCC